MFRKWLAGSLSLFAEEFPYGRVWNNSKAGRFILSEEESIRLDEPGNKMNMLEVMMDNYLDVHQTFRWKVEIGKGFVTLRRMEGFGCRVFYMKYKDRVSLKKLLEEIRWLEDYCQTDSLLGTLYDVGVLTAEDMLKNIKISLR